MFENSVLSGTFTFKKRNVKGSWRKVYNEEHLTLPVQIGTLRQILLG
jgi:hypothetical protein